MVDEAREEETKFTDQMWEWRDTFADKFLGLFPRRTAEHLVNAQKEGILAVRSLLEQNQTSPLVARQSSRVRQPTGRPKRCSSGRSTHA